MRERPILFSGTMVRALLDGSKTQTRRIAKGVVAVHSVTGEALGDLDSAGPRVNCRFGEPGDRLWVRETWVEDPEDDGTWHYTQYMGCKGSPLSDIPRKFQKPEHCIYREGWDGPEMVWRPSIHMPRWASRIMLEITGVRVERLHDITDADALTEGCPADATWPIDWYRDLWDSLKPAANAAWADNPWVWAIEFKRITS